MTTERILFAGIAAAQAASIIASLVTGKTINPAQRGFGGGFLVDRATRPRLFWAGIVVISIALITTVCAAAGVF